MALSCRWELTGYYTTRRYVDTSRRAGITFVFASPLANPARMATWRPVNDAARQPSLAAGIF
jgi:hypothetical protein